MKKCIYCFLLFLAACGGGGGGGAASPPLPPVGIIVGGSVNAPNGQIAFHRAPSGSDYWLDALIPAAHAAVPGSSPVVDGTAVDLVRLDDTGVVTETLASTTTSGGQYSFNLTNLSLSVANDLLVSARSLAPPPPPPHAVIIIAKPTSIILFLVLIRSLRLAPYRNW